MEAPGLKDDDSDDDNYQPPAKKDSSVGLFSKLPAPRYSQEPKKIPESKMTKPRQNALARKRELLQKFMKKKTDAKEDEVEDVESDNEENTNSNYFSLGSDEKNILPSPNIITPIVPVVNSEFTYNYNGNMAHMPTSTYVPTNTEYSAPPQPNVPQPSSNAPALQNKELHRIQGKKFRNEKVDFIEINADDALVGNQEILLKAISEEKDNPRMSHKKGEGPTAMQKKKHQLTYLVHQAKEREIELKNMWSQNKHSKRQSAAKYGF